MASRELQPAEVTQVAVKDALRDFPEECVASCLGIRRAVDDFSERNTAVENSRRVLRRPGKDAGWGIVDYHMSTNQASFEADLHDALGRLRARCPVMNGGVTNPGGCK